MLKPFWLNSGSCGCISRDVLVERPAGTVVIILAGRPGVVVVHPRPGVVVVHPQQRVVAEGLVVLEVGVPVLAKI